MGRFKKWLRKTYAKLRERTLWAIFTGLAQAVVRFIADQFGWPAAISTVILLGGATVIDTLIGIPSEWVWFATFFVALFLIPRTINAVAQLRKASAEEIKQANARLKLDQAERGLRVPKAGGGAVQVRSSVVESDSDELIQELEQIYSDGVSLIERGSRAPKDWRQQIIDWFGSAEDVLENKGTGNDAFMFRTYCSRPKSDEKFDDCPKLLQKRLAKLRLIIGRMHTKKGE